MGIIVAALIFVGSTHAAHAEGWFGFPDLWSIMSRVIAYIVNMVLAVCSWFVAMTGTLLNVSINLTMHIKDFVSSTPAIYDVWRAIRDISGMFIIFGLLYASIRMILGQDAKLGTVIKNIVIAGVLINFSFFMTSVLIDASNIVSLQLYHAMTPGQPDIGNLINNKDPAAAGSLPGIVNKVFSDGGLSMVFMQSLQIQTAFNPKNLSLDNPESSASFSTPFRIVLIGATGIVIMITAGLSFLFASLAFVVRLIILLILLAFSPIWFAAAVIPQLKEYSDEWWKVFKGQLIFMPAYLLFMYVALRIITNSNLFNSGAYATLWKGTASSSLIPTEFIAFGINAALIIIMLNIPLLAAIKLGASTGKLLDGKKLGAEALWGRIGGYTGSAIGRNTAGRIGSQIDKRLANTRIGNSLVARDFRAATTGALAKNKFGGSRSFDETVKEQKAVDAKAKEIDRRKQFDSIIANKHWGRPDPNDPNKLHIDTLFSGMNKGEKLALGAKTIAENDQILMRMKSGDFDAIKDATEGYTDEDKKLVADARKDLLQRSATAGDVDTVKKLIDNMSEDQWKSMKKDRVKALKAAANANSSGAVKELLKDMDGKELKSVKDDSDPSIAALIMHPRVVEHFTPGQLKKLAEEGLDDPTKQNIGQQITLQVRNGRPHQAFKWITERQRSGDWT